MTVNLKNRMPRVLMIGYTVLGGPIKAIFTVDTIVIKLYNPVTDEWDIIDRDVELRDYSLYFDAAYISETDYEFAKLLEANDINIRMVR